jgi:hypothetical protein
MPTGTVTASSLHLRAAPDGEITGSLPRGATLTIVGETGQWLEVQCGGQRGFVSARFVDVAGSAPAPQLPPAAAPGDVRFDGDVAVGPGGLRFGRRFQLGIFNYGSTTIAEFLKERGASGTATSLLRIMGAVSANEGKLEAINTWDNCFMTFGIFQWTAGQNGESGELAAMLARLKTAAPASFTEYFGKFGLDATVSAAAAGTVPRGELSLGGTPLRTAAAKGALRSLDWAYRFWRAGHDDQVRMAQLEHAMSRLACFHRVPSERLRGRSIADYVTSEYGIALLLDEHVNRPGHVPGTLGDALAELAGHADVDHPDHWSDHEEQELLAIYVERRATTSMTDSAKRAEAVHAAMTFAIISGDRGSFQA